MEKPAADGASREELLALVAARDVELAARDATLASALAERDSLRRRLELPNVRAALLGEGLLDVLGLVAAVGYAADVSHCRELCRLTHNVVQRGDVADMLEQSLRLQCGAREAREAEREDCDGQFEKRSPQDASDCGGLVRTRGRRARLAGARRAAGPA